MMRMFLVRALEPQLVKADGRDLVDQILGKTYATDEDLLKFMQDNKTECAFEVL